MALTGTISVSVNLTDTRAGNIETAAAIINPATYFWNIAAGTGSGQADKKWSDRRTIAPSATDSLDLAGILADLFGTITFVKLKAVVLYSAAANLNNIQILRPAANGVALFGAASGQLADLTPGGIFAWASPAGVLAVTPGTGDLISVVNAAGTNSVSYDIHLVGTSA